MSTPPLGSEAWLHVVRSTPPERDVLGRSRPTHQYAPYIPSLERRAGLEGANELTCALLLDIWQRTGLVTWFKEQPFTLTKKEYGFKNTPDFIFQWFTGKHFVMEAKSAKHVTKEVMDTCMAMSTLMERSGMTYLLWTDKNQIGKPLKTNVRRLWKARGTAFKPGDVERATKLMRAGPTTIGALLAQQTHPELIRLLLDRGVGYCNLTEQMNEHTAIQTEVNPNAYNVLLGGRPDPESWWNALQDLG